MSIMEKINSGDVTGIANIPYEDILVDIRNYVPNINSKGNFVVDLSGLCDDSREGIDCEVNLEIKDNGVFDTSLEDFQGETFEHVSLRGAVEDLSSLIHEQGIYGDPYKTINCSVDKFNGHKPLDIIKKLGKFIIKQERNGDKDNIVAKLSIVYTVVSFEFAELNEIIDFEYNNVLGCF